MSTEPHYIAQARAAADAAVLAEEVLRAEQAKLSRLERQFRQAEAERTQSRAEEDEDEALRQLDGEDAVPVNSARVKRLAALDKAVPARAAAIRLQRDRIAAAEATMREMRNELAPPALNLVADIQHGAAENIRAILAQLAPDFARLIASDQIRTALLGERFPVPSGCPVPIGGLPIVQGFGKSLPDRLKPPELAEVALFEAAHAFSSEILSQIKG